MNEINKEQVRLLKDQLYAGISIIIIAVFIAILVSIIYLFTDVMNLAPVVLWMINLIIILLPSFVVYLINKEVYRDIKCREIEEVKSVIIQKNETIDYEPGSGALFIPVLGNLFPKIWGQKMKEVTRYEIITKEKKAEINKELYESLHPGENVILNYGKYSKTFLGISKA